MWALSPQITFDPVEKKCFMFRAPKASWKLKLSKIVELYLLIPKLSVRGAGCPRPLHLIPQKCLFVFMVLTKRLANVLVK